MCVYWISLVSNIVFLLILGLSCFVYKLLLWLLCYVCNEEFKIKLEKWELMEYLLCGYLIL